MIEVYYKKSFFKCPTEWNELTRKQVLQVMKILYGQTSEINGILMLFRCIASIPWWQFYTMRTGGLLNAALEATEFLVKENNLTKNLIPKYRGFYGPADQLGNLRMGEFCFAEFFYLKYRNSKEYADLDDLVSVLYRPGKRFYNHRINEAGDHRKPFNPNVQQHLKKSVKRWPLEVKHAILHFYEASRDEKIRNNDKVFSKGGGESLYGMWSTMRGVAKTGHFGDFDKVQEQYVDTILMELNETVAEAEEMEREQNKVKVK